jgi:hypothetical protein
VTFVIPDIVVTTKRLVALLCSGVVVLYHGVRWLKWLLWTGFVLCYGLRSGINLAGGYYFAGEYLIYHEE